MLDSEITSYLKGFAISSVLLSHFSINFFDSSRSFAYSIVAIFFVLSGAGIYLSLDRQVQAAGGGKACAAYLLRRIIRIFPLYWLAYFLFMFELYLLGRFEGFSYSSLALTLIGVPTNPRGIYWFVTAILQCYVLAPFFFLIIKKAGVVVSVGLAVLLMGFFLPLTSALGLKLVDQSLIDLTNYKNIFLGNVLLFFLGMTIPPLLSLARPKFNKPAWIGTALLFIFLVFVTDSPYSFHAYLVPLFMVSVFLFCLATISIRPSLPFTSFFTLAGRNSYPIYLFHETFFLFLATLGIIRPGSLAGVVYTILLFPLFFAACVLLQSLSARLKVPAYNRMSPE